MLTDIAIRNAKPSDKPVRKFDGGGLYLEIAPTGGMLWRLKYRFDGKEKRLALGTYPDVGLQAAREGRENARKLLAAGVDPLALVYLLASLNASNLSSAASGQAEFSAAGPNLLAAHGTTGIAKKETAA